MKLPKHVANALRRAGVTPQGVTCDRPSRKHLRITLPCGKWVTCAGSPSDSMCERQIARDIERVLGRRPQRLQRTAA